MSARVTVLNGPNLNLLGVREPHIYGTTTLQEIETACGELARNLGASLECHQSNHEGVLVDLIQAARDRADALIINPAGFTYTSHAIVDALKMFEGPIIELHISNVHTRDRAHHHSGISPAATAVICGLGTYGYLVAIQSALRMLDALPGPASLPSAPR